MTRNFDRRMDKLDRRIEERNIIAAKNEEPLSLKRMARIIGRICWHAKRPDATPRQKEAARLIAKILLRREKVTESE